MDITKAAAEYRLKRAEYTLFLSEFNSSARLIVYTIQETFMARSFGMKTLDKLATTLSP